MTQTKDRITVVVFNKTTGEIVARSTGLRSDGPYSAWGEAKARQWGIRACRTKRAGTYGMAVNVEEVEIG